MTLAIESNGGSELTYELSKQSISIGASSQNDVVLRVPGVAPRHLTLQRNESGCTFLAQHRQFVVLNGERRSRGVLRVGDRIRIGTATIVFRGVGDEPTESDSGERGRTAAAPASAPVASPPRRRSEVVLFSEPRRLAESRRHLVEIFRAGVRSDIVPSLRTFLSTFFPGRQAMLAWKEDDGRLQPIVSEWTGEVPRLPARTFEELASDGRFALLRLLRRTLILYPVDRGELESRAYLVVECDEDDRQDDEIILAELARLLSIHWQRVESSSTMHGAWEAAARSRVERELPGTSRAIRVLRDEVVEAARSTRPVLLCGREGSGRMWTAALIASLHPSVQLKVHSYEARKGDDEAFRLELLGAREKDRDRDEDAPGRFHGAAIVIREVHLLGQALQREISAVIREDLESGYGPSARWMVTSGEDGMRLVTEGELDTALFDLFRHHVIRTPSLEERREDLPLLAVRLLDAVGREQDKEIKGIELETLNSLLHHGFEGEMAELLGELRRLVSATPPGEMVRGLIPAPVREGGFVPEGDATTQTLSAIATEDDLKTVIPAVERLIIDRVLRRTKGNQSKAARTLNLSRGALIAKMKEYEIPDYRYLRRQR